MKKIMIINGLIFLFYSCSMLGEKVDLRAPVENINIKNEIKIKKYTEKYDLKSDNSVTKFVNNKISFNDLNYVPLTLVNLEGEFILDSKGNSKLRKVALDNLNILSKKFNEDFGEKLKIVSAYRSYEYQKGIKDRGCSDLFCAKAGFSEHQSGLAIDFWETTNKERFEKEEKLKKYFEWMKINGPKNGFTNTYQKGKDVDGYTREPWHWRYIGKEFALYLDKENITFAEFYNKNITIK